MRVSKYPVISKNNKKYKVVIRRIRNNGYDDYMRCYLYKVFCGISIPVYKDSAKYIYTHNLKNLVKDTVESYEYIKGYGVNFHSNLEKFNNWDGDLR